MEFTLLGAAALAVASGYAVLWYEAGRTNAADCTRDVWDALAAGVIVGLILGRLVAMISAGTNPISHPADILLVRGGVDTVAAAVAGLAGFAFSVRHDMWALADAAAPAAAAGLAGWHAGCIVRSGCLGAATDLPWAVSQAGSEVGRHPVEIYAALLLITVTMLLVVWKRRRPPAGTVAFAALLGAAAVRLATEPLRLGIGSDLAWWYAVGSLAAGAGWLWRRHRSQRDPAA